ncbi:OLC1v1034426C1 [Oldenlandia corymbosa var. corymbosa]|uniref:Glycosyltransferase n=1 Tax=Oldenlandia corymbosa var. corymbosa TaxID=529605 RepID=A0AAV1CTE9_OLDCO|nr:OLC1v1034426C1 [Oldenlandia corymbosa var. corymbosa]
MASKKEELNFILIPFGAPGHILPMIDMAKMLARQGVMVTVITTAMNAIRFGAVIDRAAASGLSIRLLQVQFPAEEAGLPKGCESFDDLPSYSLFMNFFSAIEMLQKPIEKIVADLSPSPSCIICDKHFPWAVELGRKYRIPWVSFDGMNCFTQVCAHNLSLTKVHETTPEGEPFVVPNLPDKFVFNKSQLPGFLNPGQSSDLGVIRERIKAGETEAYGVVVNSFEELEGSYAEDFRKLKGGKVWFVGPLSLSNENNLDKAQRGNSAVTAEEEQRLMEWLDSWQSETVVYACLGSLGRFVRSEFMELALGLEESNHPFILVVKGKNKEDIEAWISEDGFEERIKGRGLLIRGWAPQVLILSHPSIGAFLTHCGWNSTLEGISAGLPMITRPLFAEQFFNEKLVVQVLGTGVSAGAKFGRKIGEEERPEMGVSRLEVQQAICKVMDKDNVDANERRKKAKELGEMARKAVEEGGSSYLNVSLLIQEVMRLSRSKKQPENGI